MSRHDYVEDYDDDNGWMYEGRRTVALFSAKGQAFLRELAAALDAMPVKELVLGALEYPSGAVCALGALGKARGIKMTDLHLDDAGQIAKAFGTCATMVREVEFENDEFDDVERYASLEEAEEHEAGETGYVRWLRVRQWIDATLRRGETWQAARQRREEVTP
jgi:hypothetical protein